MYTPTQLMAPFVLLCTKKNFDMKHIDIDSEFGSSPKARRCFQDVCMDRRKSPVTKKGKR